MSSKAPFSALTKHKSSYLSISPTLQEHSCVNKTVLITGRATGVGFSIAQAFCTAGCKQVILSSRNEEVLRASKKALEKEVGNVHVDVLPLSLDDEAGINAAWSSTLSSIKVDIVVLCAAYSPKRGASATIETDDAAQAMQTNIIGNWVMAKCYLAHCQTRHFRGTLVDISSGAAHSLNGRNSVYGASKLGSTFLLRALALENKSHLRSFSIHPGMVFSVMSIKAGYKRGDLPVDDDDLVGCFVVWLVAGDKAWLEGRFVWATWDVDELTARRQELIDDESLLTLGLIGW